MSRLDRVLKWIEPEDNPHGTIYGAIAAGLVVAAEDPRATTYRSVLVASIVAVAAYWLAHGYAHWAAQRLGRGADADSRWSARELAHALGHEWPLAEGAAIPLLAIVVAWCVGAPLAAGVAAGVWTAAGALLAFELAGGLRRRLRPLHLFANAAVGVCLGVGVLSVKLVLH